MLFTRAYTVVCLGFFQEGEYKDFNRCNYIFSIQYNVYINNKLISYFIVYKIWSLG